MQIGMSARFYEGKENAVDRRIGTDVYRDVGVARLFVEPLGYCVWGIQEFEKHLSQQLPQKSQLPLRQPVLPPPLDFVVLQWQSEIANRSQA